MPFTVKDWRDYDPSTGTGDPSTTISAAALDVPAGHPAPCDLGPQLRAACPRLRAACAQEQEG
jgi:hypothetical protein